MGVHWRVRGFTVEELLGSGGTAEVWRARVAGTGELVALKRIVLTDPERAARARAEADLLARLDHPNLIRLHAAVPTGDALVLVLDLADNGSLRDVLVARGRLTPGETVAALAPVAAATAYLHSESVVHGDVSAANILFTESGVPLLADVGVARVTGDDSDAESTPIYIDPAVAAGGVPGPSSDVFMLGAVAFHALTGEPLWLANGAAATVALAANGVPDGIDARLAAAGVPDTVAAPVLRALSAQPHDRGSAVEFALDLRHGAAPMAVEFGAGRERPQPQPLRPPDEFDDPGPGMYRTGSDAARPEFERPGAAVPPGREPPTRLVGPRPRPTIPRGTRRAIAARAAADRRRRTLLFGAVAAVLVTFAAVLAWHSLRPGGQHRPSAHRPPPVVPRSAARTPPSSSSSSSPFPSPSPSTETPTAPEPSPRRSRSPSAAPTPSVRPSRAAVEPRTPAGWAATLADLDAVRAEAYAVRDPTLLARVYVAGSLLERDAAQLRRTVPPGCGLTGALTQYRRPLARRAGGATILVVRAVLPATRLVCHGQVRATAASSGPRVLTITLTATAAGPRISAQRVR